MICKQNIQELIQKNQEKIDELQQELKRMKSSLAISVVKNQLLYFEENQVRYKRQAALWGFKEYNVFLLEE